MNDSEFHHLADATLITISDTLEEPDQNGTLEIEYSGGLVTIQLVNSKQWIVSKHVPTRQLWLSSPLSGGLHFAHSDGMWKLADGRELLQTLAVELKTLAHIEVQFA